MSPEIHENPPIELSLEVGFCLFVWVFFHLLSLFYVVLQHKDPFSSLQMYANRNRKHHHLLLMKPSYSLFFFPGFSV